MKKILLLITLCLLPLFSTSISADSLPSQKEEVPPYAKWGRVAMQTTKERYPEVEIIDYLHIGASVSADGTTTEKFKLWLRGKEKEFGVFITIRFNTETEEIIEMTFEETDL